MRYLLLLCFLALLLMTIGCQEAAQALSTTISGNVQDDGEPVSGALVFVLEFGAEAEAGMSLESGSITGGEGNYTVIEVDPGEYYVCAIKDENGNLTYDRDTDPIGYYGTVDTLLSITIPAKVTIEEEGQDVIDIDIEDMFIIPVRK